MSIPKITVLMPVYNGGKYLYESIDSILKQTFSDFDFLIINDGSTDNSAEVITSFSDPRIRYIENEKNIGLIATLNKGLGLAQGKYIARMDQDDVSLRDRLSQQVSFLDTHPEVAVLGTAVQLIGSDGTILDLPLCFPSSSNCIEWSMHFYCPIAHPSVLMRKDVVMRANGYAVEALHAEDYDLWVRLSETAQLVNLDQILLKLRKHETNITKVYLSENLDIANYIARKYTARKLGELDAQSVNLFGGESMNMQTPVKVAERIFKLYLKTKSDRNLSSSDLNFIRQDAGKRLFGIVRNNPLPFLSKLKILTMIGVVNPAGTVEYGIRWVRRHIAP